MKHPAFLIAWIAAALLLFSVQSSRANLEVSASVQIHATADFYAPLTTCGTWVSVGSYGQCWRPGGVVVGWQPYCEGWWVWTDCGWYWQSDEPWAWACYHYGWWAYDDVYGWVWVPDVEWAPAWVCWRIGVDFIGWAPLPRHGTVVGVKPVDAAFVFVSNDHFSGHINSSVVVKGKPELFKQTRFISNVKHDSRSIDGAERKVVVNEGPGLDAIKKATGKSFELTPIRNAVLKTHGPAHLEPRKNIPQSSQPSEKADPQKPLPRESEPPKVVPVQPNQNPPSLWPGNGQGHDKDEGGGLGGGHGHGHGPF